jgi:hypothetical protein
MHVSSKMRVKQNKKDGIGVRCVFLTVNSEWRTSSTSSARTTSSTLRLPCCENLNVRFRELVDSRKNIDGQKEKHL